MAFAWIVFALLVAITNADRIELIECNPPDVPVWGGYGPRQEYYVPGDFIHYYCDTDTYIGGNYYRKCEDTGDWTGNTPVCDGASAFSSTTQSSISDEASGPELAVDGIRSTCTSTSGFGEKEEWSGNFTRPGDLIRVMIFLPKGPVSYEVVLVRQNGEEMLCGSQTAIIDRYDWTFHNCPGPHNTGVTGLKIRSLKDEPLKICEIAAHVLVSPKCVDPHIQIESGHFRLNRQRATLVCDKGYTRSPDANIDCVRDGVWNRKNIYCTEPQWERDSGEVATSNGDRVPDSKPDRQQNPNRERDRFDI